jgi:hypothetical protein
MNGDDPTKSGQSPGRPGDPFHEREPQEERGAGLSPQSGPSGPYYSNAGYSRSPVRPSPEPQSPVDLETLRLEERRLSDQLDEDTRRAASTRRILFVVILLIAASTALLFRDLNFTASHLPALMALVLLSIITVILLALHNTGVHTTVYKLHLLQRAIRAREAAVRPRSGEDLNTGSPTAPP